MRQVHSLGVSRFAVVVFLLLVLPASTVAQQHIEHQSSGGLSYLVTLPSEYHAADGPVPTLLFLHGGDRSNTRHHPARYAAEEELDFPFLVVAPHCTPGCSWPAVDFDALLAEVSATYSIDRRRIYLTGYSMGGYGAWGLLAKRPDLFAAAAPIAGGGDPDTICEARSVPIRAYHGDRDDVIPHAQSVAMIEALDQCDGQGDLVTLPGVDHASWIPTFKDAGFYEWLLQHRRPDGESP